LTDGGISIRKAVRLSWLCEISIRGASAEWRGSMGDSASMLRGGADASISGIWTSGGADGRRASSLSARAALLILDREFVL
jgi:hypothetical protein